MKRMILKSRVGTDGVLHVSVPVGQTNANREVQVTIEAVPHSPMPQEEWRQFVLSTAGSVTDPTFIRHEQGQYEERQELP